MKKGIGKKKWVIGDGYLPRKSHGEFISHESICVLNTGHKNAHIKITIYFEDREPLPDFEATCKAQRTNHIRMEKMKDKQGRTIPRGVPYAIKVESSSPVIVQHTRLDTSQAELSLMTTMGFPVP